MTKRSKVSSIDKNERILNEIPKDLRPVAVEVMLRLGHVIALADVRDRPAWLSRIKMNAMGEGDLRRAFVGSKKSSPAGVRTTNPSAIANHVLSLVVELEQANLGNARLTYEQIDAISKAVAEAAHKLVALNNRCLSPRLLQRAG